jgi:ferredoxin
MSLDVHKMVQNGKLEHSECILCGTCAHGCPNDAIKFYFGQPEIKPKSI